MDRHEHPTPGRAVEAHHNTEPVPSTHDIEDARRLLAITLSPEESEDSWSELLKQLLERGLSGVELVIADEHAGLAAAVRRFLPEVRRQRGSVPPMDSYPPPTMALRLAGSHTGRAVRFATSSPRWKMSRPTRAVLSASILWTSSEGS